MDDAMMKKLGLLIILGSLPLLLGPIPAAVVSTPPPANVPTPTHTADSACTSGPKTCTTGFSPTNTQTLLVWVCNDSPTTAVTLSDGEGTGNTYTRDIDIQFIGQMRCGWFHASNISGSGTYTLTCTGTGTSCAFEVFEFNNLTGTLASVSVGSNPDSATVTTSPIVGSGFTTSNATAVIVGAFSDVGSGSASIGLSDATFTKASQECTNGGSCFITSGEYKIVTSAAAFTAGFTFTGVSHATFGLAAYK